MMNEKSALFLDEADVDELTGIGRGRTERTGCCEMKYTKFELQVRQLRIMGLPFFVNARGRPIIARAALEGRKNDDASTRPTWEPRAVTAG